MPVITYDFNSYGLTLSSCKVTNIYCKSEPAKYIEDQYNCTIYFEGEKVSDMEGPDASNPCRIRFRVIKDDGSETHIHTFTSPEVKTGESFSGRADVFGEGPGNYRIELLDTETLSEDTGRARLKKYMIQHADTNSEGNKIISSKKTDTEASSTYTIVYETSEDDFLFSSNFIYSENGSNSSITMAIPSSKDTRTVKVRCNYEDPTEEIKFSAMAVVLMPTYQIKAIIPGFIVTSSSGSTHISDGAASSIAEDQLYTSMLNWDDLLKEKSGLTMKDIGFTSFPS